MIRRILVPTDLSAGSREAVAYGEWLAESLGATVHLVHVIDDLGAMLARLPSYSNLSRLQGDLEVSAWHELGVIAAASDPEYCRTRLAVLTAAQPAAAIVEYARDAGIDLVVMGTHGRGPVRRLLLGTVADSVIRHAPCPVVTVRESKAHAPRMTPSGVAVAS
jgi:nucleotide-binding universal stress UspA family protein